jgi:steroid 5-alpha reductase family enzyme
MNQASKSLAVIIACLAVASAVAWAGGQGAAELGGLSIVGWCAASSFLIQWLAFLPSYRLRTERYYDLTGSLTYIGLTILALSTVPRLGARSMLLGLLVIIWAGRLGTFLFLRIRAAGSDSRFDSIKTKPWRFLVAWTLQGLWVFLTLCAALAAMTAIDPTPLGGWDALGLGIWVVGFAIEVIADRQKSRFRDQHPNRFVDEGLWAWSRHPNYFGEILLWTGVAVIASATLRGWQWVTWVSPAFVTLLLTRISGVPILERRADERWGGDANYERYKANTPVLVPRPPRRSSESQG